MRENSPIVNTIVGQTFLSAITSHCQSQQTDHPLAGDNCKASRNGRVNSPRALLRKKKSYAESARITRGCQAGGAIFENSRGNRPAVRCPRLVPSAFRRAA